MPRRAVRSPDYQVPIEGFTQLVEAPADGRLLFVSGITARDGNGTIVSVGDAAGQARQVLRRMEAILQAAGAGLDDVVQVRTYLCRMEDWAAVEEVWRDVWAAPWPASTCVEVSRLYDERQLVEMDAVAVASPAPDD